MKKLIIPIICIALIFSGCTKIPPTKTFEREEEKTFTLVIEAENNKVSRNYTTSCVYLGDFLEEEKLIEFEQSSYGRFIHAVDGIYDDESRGLWWVVYVNAQSPSEGVDKIKLEEGSTYTLSLIEVQ